VIVATSASATKPLTLVELPSPSLRNGEIRVKVHTVGVNPVDWKMREGGPLRMAHRVVGPRGPLVVGIDFSGEVIEVSPSVTDMTVGTRVVGGTNFSRGQLGSYATEVVVRPDQCAVLPQSVSFDDAACLPIPGVTAWRALTEMGSIGSRPGMRVLVLGASGGVGLFAIQLARDLKAHVWGVCSTRNADVVRDAGAEVIDYTQGDALVAAKAHGPFDAIINAVGTTSYPLQPSRLLLAPQGRIGLVVVQPSDYPSLVFRGDTRSILGKPTREFLTPLVERLARGAIKTRIEATWSLAEAEVAHAKSRTGKVVGKLLLHPG
jgi:NADPH:quinone reductase